MKKYIIIVLLLLLTAYCLVLTSAQSHAAPMTGGDYTIPDLVISGGGHPSMEGGAYKMHDLKGQTVIGESTGGDYTVYLGGIYTAGQAIVTGDWPYGTCPLYISRDGSDIKITWEAKIKNPSIYVMVGTGEGEYVSAYDANKWIPVNDLTISTEFDDANGLGDGILLHQLQIAQGHKEVYYKGLQAGVSKVAQNPKVQGKTYFESALAGGKVIVDSFKVGGSAWNFVATPVFHSDLDEVFGTDFTLGDKLWFWDDVNQKFFAPVAFNGTTWGVAENFVRGNGALFNLSGSSPKTVTLVGQATLEAFTRAIAVKPATPSIGWNVIGDPFPMMLPMEGFGPGNSVQGDALWEWDNSQQKFLAPLSFDGTKWPLNTKIKIGKAYGYNHVGNGFTWDIPAK